MLVKENENEKKPEEFMKKVIKDISGTLTIAMCAIGDRLGLFKDLHINGPATSSELAKRNNINERYAREWLYALGAAGYLKYNKSNQQFSLPSNHAPILAQELGPMFLGGHIEQMPSLWNVFNQVLKAFQRGGGVNQTNYDQYWWEGIERVTAISFENLLVQKWIPVTSDIQSRLKKGIMVADIGCGHGRALIKLAQTFPKSTYIGYDIHEPNIARAIENAKHFGVEDRVFFKQLDIENGIPEQYDLITTFDVIHDLKNPLKTLNVIRKALKAEGTYLLLDFKSSDNLEENFGSIGALMYGFSVFFCMTTSLAVGGEGLGTLGMPPSKVKELCLKAGFSIVNQLPIEDNIKMLYEIKN
ncbi:hypothetical protein LCGC14_1263850 [marine sediment metagenome]|uniref:Uncharacterized protein n=1 Tax=marine sediment metagenome TaxID=412755 RepID=A0A0F9P3A4_9ZZZZ